LATKYPIKKKPVCPVGNHQDNIIPIIYGEPTGETMKKVQEGLVHLGGCIITDIEPKYFCKIHKKKF